VIAFNRLKYLSFAHSAIYAALLAVWLSGGPEGLKEILGWGHGIGWIVMSLLSIVAVRTRVIPLWLGVTVAVIGAVGPFAGSIGFVVHERRTAATERPLERGMV
jgi:hypothetical protein